jgi:hypothetical protein
VDTIEVRADTIPIAVILAFIDLWKI